MAGHRLALPCVTSPPTSGIAFRPLRIDPRHLLGCYFPTFILNSSTSVCYRISVRSPRRSGRLILSPLGRISEGVPRSPFRTSRLACCRRARRRLIDFFPCPDTSKRTPRLSPWGLGFFTLSLSLSPRMSPLPLLHLTGPHGSPTVAFADPPLYGTLLFPIPSQDNLENSSFRGSQAAR